MKSSETPFADSTISNGPNRVGAGRPSTSARNRDEATLSRAWTIVWFSSTAMPDEPATPPPPSAGRLALRGGVEALGVHDDRHAGVAERVPERLPGGVAVV